MARIRTGLNRKDKIWVAEAQWTAMTCPVCGFDLIAIDKFGIYCCIGSCSWEESNDYFLKYYFKDMWE